MDADKSIEHWLLWSAAIAPAATYNDPLLPAFWHLGSATGATKGANVTSV